jgi:[acyl-carrier-protein] S-malonyltransferase
MSTVFLYPGQGAQRVGMGRDFYEQFALARELFQQADDLLEFHLSRIIFEGPQEVLRETVHCQLAIYVTSWVIHSVVEAQHPGLKPQVVAGHSLGEYSALTASGRLSLEQGLELVHWRSRLMQEACKKNAGTMAAVVGLSAEELAERLKGLLGQGVWLGNVNAPDQVVLTGTREGVEKASELIRSQGGAKVVPLEVAGAFHSPLMQGAAEELEQHIRAATLAESPLPIVMNRSGKALSSRSDVLAQMIEQMRSPVQWVESMRTLGSLGVTRCVELGPGRVLSGLCKRNGLLATLANVDKVEDLEKLA